MWGKSNATGEFQSPWANRFHCNLTLNNTNRGIDSLFLYPLIRELEINQSCINVSIIIVNVVKHRNSIPLDFFMIKITLFLYTCISSFSVNLFYFTVSMKFSQTVCFSKMKLCAILDLARDNEGTFTPTVFKIIFPWI